MSFIHESSTTRGGSAVWASAMGAAMGDGIVPRTGSVPTEGATRKGLFRRSRANSATHPSSTGA